MSLNEFEGCYCPICLFALHPDTGNCWYSCKYKASSVFLPYSLPPLTELEVCNKKLAHKRNRIKNISVEMEQLEKQCKHIEGVISKGAKQ
jgi:hypothetical protein